MITLQFYISMLILTSLLSSMITLYLPQIKKWFNKSIKVVFVWKKPSLEQLVKQEVERQLKEIIKDDN